MAGCVPNAINTRLEWDSIALNYTSGTTGNRKGVLLPSRHCEGCRAQPSHQMCVCELAAMKHPLAHGPLDLKPETFVERNGRPILDQHRELDPRYSVPSVDGVEGRPHQSPSESLLLRPARHCETRRGDMIAPPIPNRGHDRGEPDDVRTDKPHENQRKVSRHGEEVPPVGGVLKRHVKVICADFRL